MALGREQRGIEFKGPGPGTDKPFAAKVIRAIMAMSNKTDGGIVVIGVEDTGTKLLERGCTPEIVSWSCDSFEAWVRRICPAAP